MKIKGVKKGGLGLGIVMAAIITALVMAFVLPIAMNGLTDPAVYNQSDQANGTETPIKDGLLNSTITDVDGVNDQITLTLKDVDSGNTQSKTVSNGTTSKFTLQQQDVNVTVHDVDGTADTAFVEYGADKTYGWSDGGQSIFNILDLIFILVAMLVALGFALKMF